jgi:hypothetical protein
VVSSTPRPYSTPGKDTVPIVQEAGWAPGPVWTGAENLAPHRDSIPGPDRPARSQSLYRLSYPAHLCRMWYIKSKREFCLRTSVLISVITILDNTAYKTALCYCVTVAALLISVSNVTAYHYATGSEVRYSYFIHSYSW